ncbi:MAG: peptidyl-prolyl cis-trans isomerase [Anaerolineales bacterium]|nr:peptidyl-prolyl cis-trans isomerase [Anaerolineales bacterium]
MILHRQNYIWIFLTLALSACASVPTVQPAPTATRSATLTPAPPTATSEPMALTVNGEGITVVEFDAEVANYIAAQSALGREVDSATATSAVIDDLVAQMLLAQAARANGFTLDDAALQARIDSLEEELGGADALEAWKKSHRFGESAFQSALKRAVESAWMRDKIISSVPSTAEQIHLQQILLYNEDAARNFLTQLNGGADFDDLAYKADPVTRGDLGWVPRGYLLEPKIEEVAFILTVGEYSDVISTDVGFHILRILARDPARALSPDARLALQELALKNWIEQERAKAKIVLAPQ